MPNAFLQKLSCNVQLTPEDVALLDAALGIPREFPARYDLIREGDKPGPVFVILEGWACRYKLLPEGGRLIIALMMPGDFCDVHVGLFDAMDHSIGTLSTCKVGLIPRERMEAIIDMRPAVTRAFWMAHLVDEAVLREWIVSMGRRDSLQRVAHLMCELYIRATNIGLARGETLELPLTQTVLGDALGLTPVHVNRVLRRLRLGGAMELGAGTLTILDGTQLAQIAGFDDTYLHRRLKRAA